MTSLFSNSHVRHSQPLNSNSHKPPSSFARGGGTSFKSSLKKIPSAFFNKEESSTTVRDKKEGMGGSQIHAGPISHDIHQQTSSPLAKGPGKTKTRTKTRKALADLFSWGNSSSSPAHPTFYPSKPLAPSMPSKEPSKKPSMVLKKNPPKSVISKSSINGLHARTSLLPTSESHLGTIRRPSMGADPFCRDGDGAEVVQHIERHSISVTSTSIARSSSSVNSSTAISGKALLHETDNVKGPQDQSSTSPTFSVFPSIAESPIDEQQVQSALLQSESELRTLPPRSTSLGRVLTVPTILSSPSKSIEGFRHHVVPPAIAEDDTTLKKEKTKSRMWGILGGKGKKTKVQALGGVRDYLPRVEEIKQRALPVDENITEQLHPCSPSKKADVEDCALQEPVQLQRATVTGKKHSIKRKQPPTFHITQPSIENAVSLVRHTNAPTQDNKSKSHVPSHAALGEMDVMSESSLPGGSSESKQVLEAFVGHRGLPKRPSLKGLFGIAIKRSMEKLDKLCRDATATADEPPSYGGEVLKARVPSIPKLRSLAEEMDEVESRITFHRASPPYRSRFGNSRLELAQKEGSLMPLRTTGDPGLQHVASATDKLSTLLSRFERTPGRSPSVPSSHPSLEEMVSFSSNQRSPSASPTPFRRTRSAVLTTRASGSPLKLGKANISPLKLALHRAHKMASQEVMRSKPPISSRTVQPMSMVKQGMRNVFAPPSPPQLDVSPASTAPSVSSAVRITDERVGLGQTMGPTPDRTDVECSDIPADLRMALGDDDIPVPASPSRPLTLGLPPRPPTDRHTPRRRPRAPPKISLPPLPLDQTPTASVIKVSPVAPHHALDFTREPRPDSILSDDDSSADQDWRYSFDFTSEYASLNQGDERASFVVARHHAEEITKLADHPEVPPLPALPYPISNTPAHNEASNGEMHQVPDAAQFEDAPLHVVTQRPAPFQGRVAFQQRVREAKRAGEGDTPGELPDEASHTALGSFSWPGQAHARGESNSTAATMSSIGAIIETGVAGHHMNYFEFEFGRHISQRRKHESQTSTDSMYGDLNTKTSTDSIAASNISTTNGRAPTRRAHHRRNSSILSVDSIGGIDDLLSSFGGPPVSMFNRRRSGYISRHRRDGSEDSGIGRSDWAAHRRNSSSDSVASIVSVSRIVRPGLGDRMFQLDGGVPLTSITGSPPENATQSRRTSIISKRNSYDSLFDSSQGGLLSFDSLLNPDASLQTDMDSIFGAEDRSLDPPVSFILKGIRPISTVSSSSASESLEDSFINVAKYGQKIVAKSEICLEGEGEDSSALPTAQIGENRSHSGRQILSASIRRPSKPKNAHRRRPAHLVFSDPDAETPGLTSPSASETSSRLSLDTRFSDGSSLFSASRIRPLHGGHQRQKSSAGVRPQATIREEPSMATLRAARTSSSPAAIRVVPSRSTLRGSPKVILDNEEDDLSRMRAVKSWLQFEREAGDEYRRTKDHWSDSEESKLAVAAEFVKPRSPTEILQFLAQSSATYKPLEQLVASRKIAHRRKSSLSDSRAMLSPYGLPLPRPSQPHCPKTSLITKFERTNSIQSTYSCGGEDETVPSSGVFAQFVRQVASSPSSARLSNTAHMASIDLKLPTSPSSSTQSEFHHHRTRVNSNVRRQALGWGKRRNSDGPIKVIGSQAKEAKGLQPLTLASSANVPYVKPQILPRKESNGFGAIKTVAVKNRNPSLEAPPAPSRTSGPSSTLNKENDPAR
ncbi:hypothetical protein BCR39DRAFT_27980 [Naematelia encephala]|uniref:Uncharacterized protein n=1 Tax=Naematelia encephala TaxID=71784 RepID=A0A1Y2BLQ8_9TREE|nr:hypothetical protein BCR39DRAFT_27980 [Naematelia encephala]